MNLRDWLQAWQPRIREFSDTYLPVRSQLNPRLVSWLPDVSRSHLTLLLAHFPSTFLQLQETCETAGIAYRISPEPMTTAAIAELLMRSEVGDSGTRPTVGGQDRPGDRQSGAGLDSTSPSHRLAAPPLVLALVDQLVVAPEVEASPRGGGWFAATPARPSSPPAAETRSQALGERRAPLPVGRLAVLVAERHFLRQRDRQVQQFVQQFVRRINGRAELAFFLALDDPLLRGRCDRMLWQLLEHYGMRPEEPLQSLLLDRLVRRVQQEHAKSGPAPRFAESPEHWLDFQQASRQ
jgi:hypothetical protein